MIKSLNIMLLFFILISCSESNSKESSCEIFTEKDTTLITKREEIILDYSDLENKVFTSGRKVDFTENCDFYFECDCCSGDYIFLKDSIFYYYEYCLHDDVYFEGKYAIFDDTVSLMYSGYSKRKSYNFENEIDTSAKDYFFSDTIYKPWVTKNYYSICNNKIKLSYIKNDYSGVSIESNDTLENVISNFEINPY